MNELEATYKWLSREKFAYRHHAIDLLINRMRQSLDNRNFPQTRALMKDLKATADTLAPELVQAYVRIECACAAYEMNEFDDAFTNIDQAIDILEPLKHQDLEYSHIYAVSYWLLGTLLFQMPDQRHAAVSALQICLDTFRMLTYWPESHFNGSDWYKKRCKTMERGIEIVVASATSAGTAVVRARPAPPARPSLPISALIKSTLRAGPYKSINVVDRIPAGPPLPSGVEPEPLEIVTLQAEMETFTIGGRPLNLYNLRKNGSRITLVQTEKVTSEKIPSENDHLVEYYILLVVGDSMNKANIEAGDYVLVRRQNTADNNDIVVAETQEGEDTTATLKKYVKINSTIELRPQSTNPKHKPFQFDKSSESLYIRGLVLGVFKQ